MTERGAAGGRRWPGWLKWGGPATLQRRLVQLVALSALPLLAMATAAIWYAYTSERARAEIVLGNQAVALAALVDEEFASAEALLRGLGASSSLAHGDMVEFRHEASAAAAAFPGASIALAGQDGRLLANTLWAPAEAPSGVMVPPALMRSLTSGQTEISDLRRGLTSGRWIIVITVPVFLSGIGEPPTYQLMMGLPIEVLGEAVLSQRLPPRWIGGVLDRAHILVARSVRSAEFVGSHAIPGVSEGLERGDGVARERNVEGVPSSVAWSVAPHSGYGAAISVPQDVFLAPLRSLLLQVIGAGSVLVLAALGAALLFARRLSRSLREVARAAISGDVVPEGVQEVNDLALELRRASRARDGALRELRGLNETLEARVQRAVAERQTAQARLVQAQKMEALGQLAGGLAHDVNNILQSVNGGVALIRRQPGDAKRVLRVATMISDVAERGMAVSRRLLAFARRDELRAAPVDVGAMIMGLQEVLNLTVGESIAMRSDIAPDLPRIHADRAQLEIVLMNLATNARDAMPAGGTLTLAADLGASPEAAAGACVRLQVRDTGAGMDAATLARAAEPFFTTKPVGEGTGLGLAMARGFAEQSGGAFAIESAAGSGTVVLLWMPVAASEDEAGDATVRAAE